MSAERCICRTSSAPLQWQGLHTLLDQNPSIDWRRVSIIDATNRGAVNIGELPPNTAFLLLQAYQRLVRILPDGEERHALPLLETGLHSAMRR